MAIAMMMMHYNEQAYGIDREVQVENDRLQNLRTHFFCHSYKNVLCLVHCALLKQYIMKGGGNAKKTGDLLRIRV